MYCAECGNAIRSELNFCNRCGAGVSSRSTGSNEVASNLSNVVGAIGVFGMLGFLAVLYLLLSNGVPWPGVTWISLFYLAALYLICSKILGHIAAQTGKPVVYRASALAPNELNSAATGQLLEDRPIPSSVVERTTRTLDKVSISRE